MRWQVGCGRQQGKAQACPLTALLGPPRTEREFMNDRTDLCQCHS